MSTPEHPGRDPQAAHDQTRPLPSETAAVPVDSTAHAGDETSGHPGKTMRQEVVARQKEEFGGMKFGSAFFGWLTATGTAVLLTALAAGAGALVGISATDSADEASDVAAENADTIGLVSAIALLVILFVAYYCGGYVAGRMARFDGIKQGIAVWIWGVVIAIIVAIIGAIAGSQWEVLRSVGGIPSLPIGDGVTTAAIITALLALAAALAGAIVGGLVGMRFHRRVDRAGLGR